MPPHRAVKIEAIREDPRVTVRNLGQVRHDGSCVLYWMQRAQRAGDNPALDVAVQVGNLLRKPVLVFLAPPRVNLRHHRFLVEGLPELEDDLAARGVGLVLREAGTPVEALADEVAPCLVVGDEDPLRAADARRQRAADHLRVACWTVDADVVVPSRLLGREHWAAYTIRPRLHEQLDRFLVRTRAPRAHVPFGATGRRSVRSLAPHAVSAEAADRSVAPVSALRGGPHRAAAQLGRFMRERLVGYARRRNRPELDGTSQLSPYLRFGHIGPRAIALAVLDAHVPEPDRAAFLEELVVRRELAVNFVRYNPRYDRLDGCERWARETLRAHARDPRRFVPERLLAAAESPDPLWNAAQRQMLETGWMHGYMRMYWAKRLLEWTRSPEEAFAMAVSLNDAYELDGGDPNGYAGVAWSIGGKHDRAFAERPVFGKIRPMSPTAVRRKMDAEVYVGRFARASGAGPIDRHVEAP